MSEEDILAKIDEIIEYGKLATDIGFVDQTDKTEAIQGLLDLYNKEKEKNKEHKERITFLENKIYNQKKYIKTGIIEKKLNVDNLCKTFHLIKEDKIKAKIEENKWAIEHYDCDEADYKQSQSVGAWNALQCILKESEI